MKSEVCSFVLTSGARHESQVAALLHARHDKHCRGGSEASGAGGAGQSAVPAGTLHGSRAIIVGLLCPTDTVPAPVSAVAIDHAAAGENRPLFSVRQRPSL
jgi:hypothetical protein